MSSTRWPPRPDRYLSRCHGVYLDVSQIEALLPGTTREDRAHGGYTATAESFHSHQWGEGGAFILVSELAKEGQTLLVSRHVRPYSCSSDDSGDYPLTAWAASWLLAEDPVARRVFEVCCSRN